MRSFLVLSGVLLIVAGLAVPAAIVATPSMLDAFKGEYPFTSGGRLDTCSTCHTSDSGGALNPYGQEYSNGFSFAGIESGDSDDDGFSNIEEINAETFPGDAGDFPSGGGGGGGEDDRVTGRGTLASGVDAMTASAATDTATGKVMAAWTQAAGTSSGADVYARLATAAGAETGKAVALGSSTTGEYVSITSGQKLFFAAWDDTDGVVGRIIKANGKAQKGPNTIAADAVDPATTYDADLKMFLVGAVDSTGVAVYQVDKKGKPASRDSIAASETIPELGRGLSFASGVSGAGYVLFGVEVKGKKQRPIGAQLVDGVAENVAPGYGALSNKDVQTAGAFADGAPGLVIWRSGTAVAGAGLNEDATLNGGIVKFGGVSADRIALAAQPDGSYLGVWVDSKTGKLWGVDLDAAGISLGEPFELQDTGEVVDATTLAAVAVKDGVLVVYATTGAAGDVRTAVVGPQ